MQRGRSCRPHKARACIIVVQPWSTCQVPVRCTGLQLHEAVSPAVHKDTSTATAIQSSLTLWRTQSSPQAVQLSSPATMQDISATQALSRQPAEALIT